MAIRNQCHIEEVVQTHQEEGFPQDRANRIHAAAMGDFKSLMNQMLQQQAHEMEAVCSQFQDEKNGTITRLETEVKDLQQCLRESETTVTSLRREKQRLEAKVMNLQQCLRESETTVTSLRREKQEQTAEIKGLKVVQANSKAEVARLNTVVCKMRKANTELNDELQEKVITGRREKEFQSQKNAFLASRHDAEIQKLREEKMTELEIAAGENQELKQTLAEQRRMQGELKVKVQEHSASISDLTRERESLQDQIRNLEDTVKRVTQKNATLEEDLMQVLQQFQGVGRHALGVHAQLMQDLMPRAPDAVRAVSAEGNTVGVDSLQDVSGAWTETFHSASLPSMSLPGALQVPVENLPDVSTELLMTYLGRISVKWNEFAHALGVGDVAANLQQMEQSPVRKCLQCLEAWIERGPEVDCSWEKLLRVLSVLKLHAVAKEILQELCRRDSSNTL